MCFEGHIYVGIIVTHWRWMLSIENIIQLLDAEGSVLDHFTFCGFLLKLRTMLWKRVPYRFSFFFLIIRILYFNHKALKDIVWSQDPRLGKHVPIFTCHFTIWCRTDLVSRREKQYDEKPIVLKE